MTTNTSNSTTTTTRRRTLRTRALVTMFIITAAIGSQAPAAHAATLPYAQAGSAYCADGTTADAGTFTASNPAYLYPANPTLAARWPGELDYWWIDVQLYTSSGWQTVGHDTQWHPLYASYTHWYPMGDGVRWNINTTGYYRALYTMYWSPTGQRGTYASGYCHVTKPTASGPWSMW